MTLLIYYEHKFLLTIIY